MQFKDSPTISIQPFLGANLTLCSSPGQPPPIISVSFRIRVFRIRNQDVFEDGVRVFGNNDSVHICQSTRVRKEYRYADELDGDGMLRNTVARADGR